MSSTDKDFYIALGNRIRQLREERDWSQEELASETNTDPAQISRIENARQSPTLDTILALSKALHQQPHELLDVGVKIVYNVPVNRIAKRNRPKTKEMLSKLIDSDFFQSSRSVDDVVKQGKKLFHTDLPKSAVSALLKELFEKRKFIRTQEQHSRSFLYKKKGK